jgi:hypothetical protein
MRRICGTSQQKVEMYVDHSSIVLVGRPLKRRLPSHGRMESTERLAVPRKSSTAYLQVSKQASE